MNKIKSIAKDNTPQYEYIIKINELMSKEDRQVLRIHIAEVYNCRDGEVSSCFFNSSWICLLHKKCKYFEQD